MGGLSQDLRYGLRQLGKNPGFTTIAVLTLALGIGANTAIFSLIDAVMLRLLPVHRPQELVELRRLDRMRGEDPIPYFTNPLWEQVREKQDSFSGVFAWSVDRLDLAQSGAVRYINGIFTSGGYFSTLGVRPALGRLFSPADDQRGCVATAVLSYGFWQERFGGESSAIGSTLLLNRHAFEVIGVSSSGFYGLDVGNKFDVAIPICSAAAFDGRLDVRSFWWLRIAGRVKPRVGPEQLKANLTVLAPKVFGGAVPEHWDSGAQQGFRENLLASVPAATGVSDLRATFGEPLEILMASVGLVLLLGCTNLASLIFARAASRHKEIAIRKALGASRARLVRQMLSECLLLSCAGTLLGALLAQWGAFLLVHFISSPQNAVFLDLSLDWRVLSFATAIGGLTAILFGTFPAVRSTRVPLAAAIKGSQADVSHPGTLARSGRWVVASQVTFSLVLLVVAGLFLRNLVKLVVLDLGFDRNNVLLVNANLKAANVLPASRLALYDEIEGRLRAIPGVVSVARSVRTPLSNFEWNEGVEVDTANPPQGPDALVYFNFVSPGYFPTLRTPLVAGRNFRESDTKNALPVAIVNQTFARKFLPGVNPVGRYFRRMGVEPGVPAPSIQIVGLVKDSKYESVREDTLSQAFMPVSQIDSGQDDGEFFEVRTHVHPASLIREIEHVIGESNKAVALDFQSLAEQVNDSLVQERLLATLSSFFGCLALLLAMIGLYGAISYMVTKRRAEFGIRLALGALPESILLLVMREVALILVSGLLAGIAISWLTVRLLQDLLFGFSSHDPVTLVGAMAVLAGVALAAGFIPARHAAKVDPMVALRYE
jgi:putative ABC transport system permease protein